MLLFFFYRSCVDDRKSGSRSEDGCAWDNSARSASVLRESGSSENDVEGESERTGATSSIIEVVVSIISTSEMGRASAAEETDGSATEVLRADFVAVACDADLGFFTFSTFSFSTFSGLGFAVPADCCIHFDAAILNASRCARSGFAALTRGISAAMKI